MAKRPTEAPGNNKPTIPELPEGRFDGYYLTRSTWYEEPPTPQELADRIHTQRIAMPPTAVAVAVLVLWGFDWEWVPGAIAALLAIGFIVAGTELWLVAFRKDWLRRQR